MTELRAGAAASALTCPRCSASLSSVPRNGTVTCPSCGLSMPVAALVELDGLTSWAGWAHARAGWLHDRLLAGDLPEGWSASGVALPTGAAAPSEFPAPPATGVTPAPARPRPGVGTLLLVGGAVLLVLAGIAFVAVAWDLLGPAGQLATLYLIGAVALLAGLRLHPRLPGTGTTLGVVGVLLVAVSAVATRALGADPMGPTAALATSTAAAVLLAVLGVWLRDRMRGAGEVAALVGAALTLGLLALAPADGAVALGEPWAWWAALVLLVGGVGVLLLHRRFPAVAWPLLASFSLLVGSGIAAAFVAAESAVEDPVRPFLASVVLLVLAACSALLVRVLPEHRPEPALAAAGSVAFAGLAAFASGMADAGSRPWSALALAAVAGFVWWARGHLPVGVRSALTLLAAAALGTAVGFAVAPWTADRFWWQGLLAGVTLSGLLVVLAELDHSSGDPGSLPAGWRGVPGLVAAVAGLFVWLSAIAVSDGPTPDAVSWAIALTLAVLAAAGWGEAVRRRLPGWSVWLSGALLLASLLPLADLADLTTAWAPELYGLVMGLVAAASGVLCWWLRRPARTPSLVVVGPALALALAPTTIAIVQDAVNRWLPGEGVVTTTYQVRVVALFVVGAALVAVGAWRGWAGVVVPAALALIVVTAVQLVDLGRFLPQWVSFAAAGGLLVLAGARWEKVRTLSREGTHWLQHLH